MKSTFEFEPTQGLVDIYVGEFKIRNSHNGTLGQVALHLSPEYTPYVSVEPHDERIGIGAVVNEEDGQLLKFMWPDPVNEKPILPAGMKPR